MVKLRTLFEVISTAKSEAEAQTLFDAANTALPDNTIGHSVPVSYVLVKLRRTLLSENFHTPMGSSHCWLYAAV